MENGQATGKKSLGEVLIDANLISAQQWDEAQQSRLQKDMPPEEYLVERGYVSSQTLALYISLYLDVPFVNLNRQQVFLDALELVPQNIARKYGLIPLKVQDGTLTVAMQDPQNLDALEDLATVTSKRIEAVLSTRGEIQEAIARHYRVSGEIERQLSQIPTQQQGDSASEHRQARLSAQAIAQAPVVRALDLLLSQAVRDRASDIHIEPQGDRVRVRFRTDGILHEMMSLPLSVHAPLLSRIKVMAGMNIAERRRPQDGQLNFTTDNREVDVRVATSNTIHGEMAVLRVLDKTFALYTLPQLGFLPDTLETYNRILQVPFGMMLISGPTGAGKTTTLYASVAQLDNVGRNLITIEDPVEYRFDNINQMQVNPNTGLTFATGLRATMRLDPDVILVGEIRDPETAQIANQAALTGHLVLSSVHANDAAGAIFRLIDLGVEPFMLASALVGTVAQRMVRRSCSQCVQARAPSSEEKLTYEEEMHEPLEQVLYGVGCNICSGTGYSGRTGIYEVMVISEEVRRLILAGAGVDDLRAKALEEGMVNLWHDGMTKVKMGITTPHEVIRNVFTLA